MKEVLIHMGFHKTASSSIQATCANNRKLLLHKGISYPVFQYNNKNITNHSIPIYSLFTDSPQNYHINIKWSADAERVNREYREQLEQFTLSDEKLILSGEGISVLPDASLVSLRDYFLNKGYRVKAIAYVRSPVSYQVSAAQERVKNGHTLFYSDKYFPSRRIKKLLSVFSTGIDFYPFRDVCSDEHGPIGYFLKLAGLDAADLKKIKYIQKNESLSDQATRLIAYINEVLPFFLHDENSNQVRMNPDRKLEDTSIFQKIGGHKYRPAFSEIQHILDESKLENEWLQATLGEEFCDDEVDLEFNETVFHWDRKTLKQLERALAGSPEPLRQIACDFFAQEKYSTPQDNIAIRRIINKIKKSN